MLQMYCYLVIVVFLSFAFCEGQQVNLKTPTATIVKLNYPLIPKCCESRKAMWINNSICEILPIEPPNTHIYFDSNQTHINSEGIPFNLSFYHHELTCNETWELEPQYIMGFIYNGSFIDAESKRLYNASDYCVNYNKDYNITIRMCAYDDPFYGSISNAQVYFPCLVVSTLCYLSAAIIYKFILKVKDVHKKCFIGYSVSMTVTFFFLILLQKINSGCAVLGAIFFLSILSSFVWLLCLCLDMVYIVRYFLSEDKPERFYLYLAGSLVIPCIMLIISMIVAQAPAVPNSFMKSELMCNFGDTPMTVLFVPIGLFLLLSLGSLIYTFYLIRIYNDKDKYGTHYQWLESKSQFKYMTRSCLMIWLPTSIWIVDAAFENQIQGTRLVYEIIEGLQGIFVIAVFVLNRYTRIEIYKALFRKNPQPKESNSKRFNKLLEKFRTESTSENVDAVREV